MIRVTATVNLLILLYFFNLHLPVNRNQDTAISCNWMRLMPGVAAGDGEVQEELISSCGNSAVCDLVVTTQKLASVSLSAANRLQEDGAQGQQLARELFHLQPLSAAHRYQELCDKGHQQLLPALLREAVRTEVLLLQDGKRTVSQSGSLPSLIFFSFESPLV